MVWVCFFYFGKSDLTFSFERVDAEKYIDTLKTNLFPYFASIHGESLTF